MLPILPRIQKSSPVILAGVIAITLVLFRASLVCSQSAVPSGAAKSDDDSISFNRDIRPILSDKCFHCHGPDEESREADLRFDQRASAWSVIEPGDPESSEMIVRILEDDPDIQMPPPEVKKPLLPEERALLQAWIKQGATWDAFWAYVPPQDHPVPTPKQTSWANNWIDQFVLARLEQTGVLPSPRADRVTLIRRLYFDLIGLPPTPAQVQAFVEDSDADAYRKVVDQLLASEHFGERLAMYWLDLVRYADTVGYHGDQDQNISPYRDWVINAFNRNLPFDQFTREQLAGDLLESPTESQKIASGYNRLLQTTHEGGLQPKEYRAIYAADRVRNVSATWMGATVGCAQCHDHKYDPYTAKDFYAMAAFFADIDDEAHFKNGTNALPTRRSPELLVINKRDREALDQATKVRAEFQAAVNRIKKQQTKLANELKAIEKKGKASSDDANGNAKGNTKGKVKENAAPSSSKQTDQANAKMMETLQGVQRKLKEAEQELTQAEKKLRQQSAKVAAIESRGAWTMISKPLDTPRVTRIFPRGNWLDETGPVVEPAIPEFMGALEVNGRRASRLDLANWLVDTDAGSGKLTARVFANRVWYLLMGVGISKSLDDFGGQGVAPVHPQLLDKLAVDFASDWNIKRLIRQICLSKTYQQSSLAKPELLARDPYNQLFARQSRYRLPAEIIRDTALSVSGLLNRNKIGGKSVKPYQPAGYYRHLNFPPRRYKHSTDESQWRRGVYVHWQRMFLHPSLKALDAPTREECTCERPRSNTPLAALALMNDPCFVEAARVFAARIIDESPSDSFDDRLDFAFRLALSRPVSDEERPIFVDVFESSLTAAKQVPKTARELLNVGQAPIPDSIDISVLAAWTQTARTILNMSETISRN